MKKLVIACVFLFGCVGDDIEPTVDGVFPEPDTEVVVGTDAAVDGGTEACPDLSYGVVRCRDLAPECSGPPQPPEVEGGLHCLPGYEDNPRVPCFCVGINSPDMWCLRDGGGSGEDAP